MVLRQVFVRKHQLEIVHVIDSASAPRPGAEFDAPIKNIISDLDRNKQTYSESPQSNVSKGSRRLARRKRVTRSRGGGVSQCDCDPLLERICDRIRQDRRQIVSHIHQSNSVLSSRLDSLERRTKLEVSYWTGLSPL